MRCVVHNKTNQKDNGMKKKILTSPKLRRISSTTFKPLLSSAADMLTVLQR